MVCMEGVREGGVSGVYGRCVREGCERGVREVYEGCERCVRDV